ncbi:MAG TPA: hypothetical protein VND64_12200 [Pirellulales bacterium]|nr:hypothetical protein [Pirellulales bacterium]
MAVDRPKPQPLRLKIEGVIGAAERIGERVRIELPTHSGLAGVAENVAAAAREADRLSRKLKRPLSLHRAPAFFLAAAVLLLGIWMYFKFFHVSILSVALPDRVAITGGQLRPNAFDASEMLQGVDAFLGIIVNIGLAFLALLGIEVMTYRKRFHELNSLVSLISMLQSNKDVLGIRDATVRAERLLYLSMCSDLLGLVSMISGYYTQENSSLLFNNLSEVIHQRCDGLKINIQLKILHAIIPPLEPTEPLKPGVTPSA